MGFFVSVLKVLSSKKCLFSIILGLSVIDDGLAGIPAWHFFWGSSLGNNSQSSTWGQQDRVKSWRRNNIYLYWGGEVNSVLNVKKIVGKFTENHKKDLTFFINNTLNNIWKKVKIIINTNIMLWYIAYNNYEFKFDVFKNSLILTIS